MKEIPLANGLCALVDDEDFEALSKHSWRVFRGHVLRSYRDGTKNPRREFMHRRLCQVSPNLDVVHKNHDKLDNRKENLMAVSRSASTQFKNARSQSGLKGVAKSKDAWMAQICVGKQSLYIGRFSDPIAAARAYDYAALMYYGPSARVNFGHPDPELLPEIVKERVHGFELHRHSRGEPAAEQPADLSSGSAGNGQDDVQRQCIAASW